MDRDVVPTIELGSGGTRSPVDLVRATAGWATAGLAIAAPAAVVSAVALAPRVFGVQWCLAFAAWAACHLVEAKLARPLVNGPVRIAGFALGMAALGIGLGFPLMILHALTGSYSTSFEILAIAAALVWIAPLALLAVAGSAGSGTRFRAATLGAFAFPLAVLPALRPLFRVSGVPGMVIVAVLDVLALGPMAWRFAALVRELDGHPAAVTGYELAAAIGGLPTSLLRRMLRPPER